MKTMKINYRKGGSGIRTTITLSIALVDTWLVAKGCVDDDWDSGLTALRQFIESIPDPMTGETFQSLVEWFMLSDIRDRILGLN